MLNSSVERDFPHYIISRYSKMATIIAKIESKINEYLKARNKEDWKEKTFTQAEKFSGIPRERVGYIMS